MSWPRPAGSSPLTRGKHRDTGLWLRGRRLIPAHAGKTSGRSVRRDAVPAHPRSRGENSGRPKTCATRTGSSPLTRGKLGLNLTLTGCLRLIPAHAGKTWRSCAASSPVRAHPRSRGENLRSSAEASRPCGSSPLTRGKPGAQKTLMTLAWAHPRSRGENASVASGNLRVIGSSPLTRGKRGHTGTLWACRGLIPAHAGKTLPDLRFYCADRSDLGNP